MVASALRRRLAVVLALAAIVGCGGAQDGVRERQAFEAMGTRIELTAVASTPAVARAGLDAARAVSERLHRRWYPWRNDAALARINRRLAAGRAATAEPALIDLLRRAKWLERASGGRFNPAIAGLVELWGFHRLPPYDSAAPDEQAIARWLADRPRAADLALGEGRVRSRNPAVQLDLGAIGKGAAVDRALAALRAAGVDHAMVNAGGDLRVIGRAGGRRWRAGIRDPGGGVLATLALEPGEAVFTSGDYGRYRESGGERRGHVLDPRTGRPAAGAVQATVVGVNGAAADAAATALLVAGADGWWAVARSLGLRYAMIVGPDGVIHVNRALARRLEPAGGVRARMHVRALY